MHCIALHCSALHCIAVHCIELNWSAMHCTASQQTQIPPLHCHTFPFLLHCICTEIVLYHCNRPRSHTFAPTNGQLTKRLPVAFSSVVFELVYPMYIHVVLHPFAHIGLQFNSHTLSCDALQSIVLHCIALYPLHCNRHRYRYSDTFSYFVALSYCEMFYIAIDTSRTSALSVSKWMFTEQFSQWAKELFLAFWACTCWDSWYYSTSTSWY